MRIYVNEKKVRFRSRVGTIASLIGLVVLVAGMIITLRIQPGSPDYPFWIAVAMGALVVGFFAAQIGNYNIRHFARKPRFDQMLDRALKGFDDKYEIYHWLLPADHVLLGPAGLYVFVLRDTRDPVQATGARWRQPFSLRRLLGLFGQEGLGDPVREALSEAERLEKWIRQVLPDVNVDIQPVVYFVEPVPIERDAPTVPPILPKELKKFLRSRAKESRLPDTVRRRLSEAFRKRAEKLMGENGKT